MARSSDKSDDTKSILQPDCCGFMKVILYQLSVGSVRHGIATNVEKSQCLKSTFTVFCMLFRGCDKFTVDYEWYRKNIVKAKKAIQKISQSNKENKQTLLATFGQEKWNSLSAQAQAKHTMFKCKECKNHHKDALNLFPIKSKNHVAKSKAVEAGLHKKEKAVGKEVAKEMVKQLDRGFRAEFECSFKEAVGLDGRSAKKKKDMATREAKKDIERQWKETSILRFDYIQVVWKDFE